MSEQPARPARITHEQQSSSLPAAAVDEAADSANCKSNQNDEHAVARSLPLRFPDVVGVQRR
jgi:hypothetical protein